VHFLRRGRHLTSKATYHFVHAYAKCFRKLFNLSQIWLLETVLELTEIADVHIRMPRQVLL
jgi:hypothetical protein